MWCGKKPCLLHKHWDNSNTQCPMGQECQEKYMKCFQPPCTDWGECSASEPLPANIKCLPNSGYLDNDCARITLIFNGNKVPQVRIIINQVWEYVLYISMFNISSVLGNRRLIFITQLLAVINLQILFLDFSYKFCFA